MMDMLFAEENLPFSLALCLMVGIGVLEGASTILGMGPSSILEGLFPNVDIDVDMDMEGPSGFSKVLGWLYFGKIPILILLVIFLTTFGLLGLGVQWGVSLLVGNPLPSLLAAVPVFFLTLPVVRVVGAGVAHIIPKDETSAVSRDTFIGRVATIVIGTAKQGEPAQAKLHDQFGKSHYIMVEPDDKDGVLPTHAEVLLLSRHDATFRAIENPNKALVN